MEKGSESVDNLGFIGFQVKENSILCTGSLEVIKDFKYLLIQGIFQDSLMIFIAGSNTENMNDRVSELKENCQNSNYTGVPNRYGTYPIATIGNSEHGGGYIDKTIPEKRLQPVNKVLAALGVRNI
jgi:hypothetical protein